MYYVCAVYVLCIYCVCAAYVLRGICAASVLRMCCICYSTHPVLVVVLLLMTFCAPNPLDGLHKLIILKSAPDLCKEQT